MEANLTYIPSSTAKSELADISLYDHVKLTAAIAACIYDYLNEKGLSYKAALFEHEKSFYDEKAFILYSMDVSGIQNFIYTIASKKIKHVDKFYSIFTYSFQNNDMSLIY